MASFMLVDLIVFLKYEVTERPNRPAQCGLLSSI